MKDDTRYCTHNETKGPCQARHSNAEGRGKKVGCPFSCANGDGRLGAGVNRLCLTSRLCYSTPSPLDSVITATNAPQRRHKRHHFPRQTPPRTLGPMANSQLQNEHHPDQPKYTRPLSKEGEQGRLIDFSGQYSASPTRHSSRFCRISPLSSCMNCTITSTNYGRCWCRHGTCHERVSRDTGCYSP